MDQSEILVLTQQHQVFAASLLSLRLFCVVCQHLQIHLLRSLDSQGKMYIVSYHYL